RGLEVRTEICLSLEDDVELRRVTVTNHSTAERVLELTSYAEVVLAVPGADAAHPVFSNLFVQTEFVRSDSAILCTRRPRSENEMRPWLSHSMVAAEGARDAISCETDRERFVGRGRTSANPAAMQIASPLADTTGSVLDPIVSLRRTFALAPDQTVRVDFVLGVTETREKALALVRKYGDRQVVDLSFDLARTDRALGEIGATEAEADLYQRLAGALVYADPTQRAASSVLLANRRGQSGLWKFCISADLPIVLLHISDPTRIQVVKELLQAHAYWRTKALPVDLVILTETVSDPPQALAEQVKGLISPRERGEILDRPAGIFIRHLDQICSEDLILLQSAARIVLSRDKEKLVDQLESNATPELSMAALTPTPELMPDPSQPPAAGEFLFHNGLGGFNPEGNEYVVRLQAGQATPMPWVNVIANPSFGTVVSESGSGYTWAENSHEFRLTPWNNDPVTDATGEAFYLRDEQSGAFWSPTLLPAPGATPYVTRHGFGYSVFEHAENGILSELSIFVAMDAPVKFAVFKLRNVSGRPRRISVTGYWEWVLGEQRQKSLLHVQTEADRETGALLARNFYNTDFSEKIAFVDAGQSARTFTGDRKEFFGRNGSLSNPAALRRERLSGETGAGLDPGGAMQVAMDLRDGEEREVRFCLGAGRDLEHARNLIQRCRGTEAAETALEGVRQYWKQTLGAVRVETPDPSVNLMANGWLLYQVLSGRLWGRSGFYQSGGAFGFRDQLQDSMALVYAEPSLTREHLLLAAARQFREGDVQHWWHPPTGRGVRTHTSDDYLWLPYVTCHYVSFVGDAAILDETVQFLEGRPIKPEEESYYDLPSRSEESGTLYVHCVRAIEHGLRFGIHGLPLIGSCDWNDGMNLVGKEGRGESVWLAFFFYDVLRRFAELAQKRNDITFAERCLDQARQLQTNVEQHGWDGHWYRRAYFDSGEALGSHTNLECQIDSLPQSWAVLSGAGREERAREAMQAVEERLVRSEAELIQLLDPPFDRSVPSPGYIQGYVPGIRENGGQYTHAAIWVVMARALLGDSDRAWELFALLNPINHGSTSARINIYKVEPYVVAADVYAVAPHTGRGGWTWYTGSACWMYRLLSETLLGLRLEGDRLRLTPRLPRHWQRCKIAYRYRQTVYHVTISGLLDGSSDSGQIYLDGEELAGQTIPLVDDRRDHTVEMRRPNAPA
ncbi:MAG: cyclic beta 1-2 glucan synthetase, partial [Verrucomicrobia bacterium]|nr:cyclic beta 1-2 glucan synthetase [Verrucomicrobiota bacterium]